MFRDTSEAMQGLLDELYLSAVDEDAAARLPGRIKLFLGGNTCCLWVFDPRSGQPQGTFVSDQPPELIARYTEHFHTLDPWREPVLDKIGRAVTGSELIPDRALAETAFYNDFARQMGMFNMLAAVVPLAGSEHLAAVTTHRGRNDAAFEAADLDRLNALLPHLRRSMQLRGLVDRTSASLRDGAIEAMLDAVAAPALVCDGQGRVLFANRRAQAAEGVAALSMAGRPGQVLVRLSDPTANARFGALVAEAARGGAGGTVAVPGGFATAGPVPQSYERFGLQPGSVLVVVQVLEEGGVAAKAAAAFGLTRAEADVAASVACGRSPEETAVLRRVALGTVRTLLRRALVKSGAPNLRQLTAILVRL